MVWICAVTAVGLCGAVAAVVWMRSPLDVIDAEVVDRLETTRAALDGLPAADEPEPTDHHRL